ncbi:MAG: aldo/keto reductase, partial [Chloroflexi bacterium]|nr:aldo/keto reductase [Chloroflexota bacterium]
MPETTLGTRTLGKSGIDVTAIGLGLWAVRGDQWGAVDDRATLDTIDAALDAGVTFFDTADVYGDGHSEELLGQAMQGRRDRFIVASKIGWKGFDDTRRTTAYDTVEKLVAGVESSLRRLQTDYLDIIQSHISYREPTMEIFVEGFQRLQRDGKVRAYGLSTSDFEYLQAFNADGGCATLQIDYSILNRTPEKDIFPYCQTHNIGVIVRGPLAMGLLTGKFSQDTVFEENDFRRNWQTDPDQNAIFRHDLKVVERLQPLASEARTMAQLALQFVLAHPAVSTVIPGAKTPAQLRDNLGALAAPELTPAEMIRINEIVPPG